MFIGCIELKSLDLSKFNTSSVENMGVMFFNCSSLEYLDISNFDTKNLKEVEDMRGMESAFDGLSNIKYINLYNITNSDDLKSAISVLNNKSDLIVCQKEDIIENVEKCCDFNLETKSCIPEVSSTQISDDITQEFTSYISENTNYISTNQISENTEQISVNENYIIVKYKELTEYNLGFKKYFREGISYIIFEDSIIQVNESLLFKQILQSKYFFFILLKI